MEEGETSNLLKKILLKQRFAQELSAILDVIQPPIVKCVFPKCLASDWLSLGEIECKEDAAPEHLMIAVVVIKLLWSPVNGIGDTVLSANTHF